MKKKSTCGKIGETIKGKKYHKSILVRSILRSTSQIICFINLICGTPCNSTVLCTSLSCQIRCSSLFKLFRGHDINNCPWRWHKGQLPFLARWNLPHGVFQPWGNVSCPSLHDLCSRLVLMKRSDYLKALSDIKNYWYC